MQAGNGILVDAGRGRPAEQCLRGGKAALDGQHKVQADCRATCSSLTSITILPSRLIARLSQSQTTGKRLLVQSLSDWAICILFNVDGADWVGLTQRAGNWGRLSLHDRRPAFPSTGKTNITLRPRRTTTLLRTCLAQLSVWPLFHNHQLSQRSNRANHDVGGYEVGLETDVQDLSAVPICRESQSSQGRRRCGTFDRL